MIEGKQISKGKQNRTLGHNAERFYARVFRYLGFDKVKTSRYASKNYDDSKIDLVYLPFNIQIKAGVQKGLNYSKELWEMSEKMKENFPETDQIFQYPKMIIHRKKKEGRERNEFDDLVVVTFKDFTKLLKYNLKFEDHEDYNKL